MSQDVGRCHKFVLKYFGNIEINAENAQITDKSRNKKSETTDHPMHQEFSIRRANPHPDKNVLVNSVKESFSV